MRTAKFSLRTMVILMIGVILLAAALPGVSADTLPLPTLRATRTASGNTAATAAAASTKLAATAAAVATKGAALKATVTIPATVASGDAAAAIAEYASRVLGIGVTVKKAGGVTGEFTRALSQTPSGSAAQSAVVKLAGVSYGATLSNGAATLSYGSGTISGDLTIDVQAAGLGVYSLVTSSTGALNADSALALAKSTFPGVAGLSYKPYSVSSGYAWYAASQVTTVDPATRKTVTMAQAVVLYILPGTSGKASVSATVGRGQFAQAIKAP